MNPRPTIYKSDLTFTLIDNNQYQISLPIITTKFENAAPAIAQAVCYNLALPAKAINIKYFNNRMMEKFGAKFSIDLRSKNQLNDQEEKIISKAIEDGISSIDTEKFFNFQASYSIEVTDQPSDDQDVIFTWKISKRTYDYNSLNKLQETAIEFIDDSKALYRSKSHTTRFTYDHCSNPVSITYEYNTYTLPSEESLKILEDQARQYVAQHKNCAGVLNSIISKDFNLALRRACFAGELELVIMLFKFSDQYPLNLDLNQASSNGKTPLDYAIASKNEKLIELLVINDAKTREQLRFALADTDRIRIIEENNRTRQGNKFNDYGFDQPSTEYPSQSRHGLFGHHNAEINRTEQLLDEARKMNEENHRRINKERQEFERRENEDRERMERQRQHESYSISNPSQYRPSSIFEEELMSTRTRSSFGMSNDHSPYHDLMHECDPFPRTSVGTSLFGRSPMSTRGGSSHSPFQHDAMCDNDPRHNDNQYPHTPSPFSNGSGYNPYKW